MNPIDHDRQDDAEAAASPEATMETAVTPDAVNQAFSGIDLTQLESLPRDVREKVEVALVCAQIVDLGLSKDIPEDVRQMAIADTIQRCGKAILNILRGLRPSTEMLSKAAAL